MLGMMTVAVLAMVRRGDSHTRNFCEFLETQRFPEIGLEPSEGLGSVKAVSVGITGLQVLDN
jgi:hypothetical protein